MMAEDLKGSGGVAERASDFAGRAAIDEIGSESLVHPLFGIVGLKKELAAIA
jgi:hypothetical protein